MKRIFFAVLFLLFLSQNNCLLAKDLKKEPDIKTEVVEDTSIAFLRIPSGLFKKGVSVSDDDIYAKIFKRFGVESSEKTFLYLRLAFCFVKAFCIILIARLLFRKKPNAVDEEVVKTDENAEEDNTELTFIDKTRLAMYFFAVVAFGISAFGLVNLSDFLLNRTILSLMAVILAYILSNILKISFRKILSLGFWGKSLKIRQKTSGKIDVWFEVILDPIIMLSTIVVLLGLWGVSSDILLEKIKKFLMGFSIGGVKISITSILLGILVYFVSMSIFRIIKVRFLGNAFEKMDIDYSARSSLSSGFSFFGFIASAFFSIAVMGVSIGNITIIAGALSFGVGLGLQNIINNFVSGVLILFERPIKIGDVVNINGQEGTVRQISIRSTELETPTKSSIIIPNANIISGIVVNMTHNNKQTRIDLRFLLDINNDPKTIMEILLAVAEDNKKVMPKPSPSVSFNDFSNNGLDFTLNCYITDIANKQNTINDLRIEIFNKFKDAGIRASMPQRIIRLEDSREQNSENII